MLLRFVAPLETRQATRWDRRKRKYVMRRCIGSDATAYVREVERLTRLAIRSQRLWLVPLCEPLALRIKFLVPRDKNNRVRNAELPYLGRDLAAMEAGVMLGMSRAGLWTSPNLVCSRRVDKRYADGATPGVLVELWNYADEKGAPLTWTPDDVARLYRRGDGVGPAGWADPAESGAQQAAQVERRAGRREDQGEAQ